MNFRTYLRESNRTSYWLKHPKDMTKEEFFNPPEILPDPGHRLLYHATKDNETARKIYLEGLLISEMRVEPHVIWAGRHPNAYSRTAPLVIFQVPEDDPLVEYVAGDEATVARDVLPKDIIALDLVYTILDKNRLSKFQKKYTEIYWDELQKEKEK